MKYKIEFQYMPEGRDRPFEEAQDERIEIVGGQAVPIPSPGDTVFCSYDGHESDFKVVSRHFMYMGDWCAVNIVVTDVSDDEMGRRLKM